MSQPKILVIEDEKWMREHFDNVLAGAGFGVKIVGNAFEAIDLVDEFEPNLILADVLLEGDTIFPFLSELQSYGDTAGLPVVICTNLAEDLRFEDLESYGVVKLLDKTKVTPEDIVAAIKMGLSSRADD